MDAHKSLPLITFIGSTVLLSICFSIDFTGLSVTDSIFQNPIRTFMAAILYSAPFTYYTSKSNYNGRKLFFAIFSLLYGVHYLSLILESLYLEGFFSSNMISGLIINSGITSALYAWFITHRNSNVREEKLDFRRLQMPISEWIWKLFTAGLTYLILFLVFGIFVYAPIAKNLDPAGYFLEQGMILSSRMVWILPIEIARGIMWIIASVLVIRSLDYGWKKTGLLLAILYAVPMTASMLLPTSMSNGIVVAHIVELFGENLVYGFFVAWILGLRDRLPVI